MTRQFSIARRILVLRAYLLVLRFDYYLAIGNIEGLLKRVSGCRLAKKLDPAVPVEQFILAIDLACLWYWRSVSCLQRAAATVSLMRQCGVNAELVIGAQRMPFKAHAWVEVDKRVVGERSGIPASFAILDRC
jgi:hypothetical protein